MVNLTLVLPSGPRPGGSAERTDLDDFPTLIMVTCDLLGETDCRFRAGGFGHDEWAVDVSYDLSTLMEQLPDALSGLRAGEPSEIDLYGQGLERTLYFSPDGVWVDIECRSRTSWTPAPAVVRQGKDALVEMLEKLARDFAEAVAIGVPELADEEVFALWRRGQI